MNKAFHFIFFSLLLLGSTLSGLNGQNNPESDKTQEAHANERAQMQSNRRPDNFRPPQIRGQVNKDDRLVNGVKEIPDQVVNVFMLDETNPSFLPITQTEKPQKFDFAELPTNKNKGKKDFEPTDFDKQKNVGKQDTEIRYNPNLNGQNYGNNQNPDFIGNPIEYRPQGMINYYDTKGHIGNDQFDRNGQRLNIDPYYNPPKNFHPKEPQDFQPMMPFKNYQDIYQSPIDNVPYKRIPNNNYAEPNIYASHIDAPHNYDRPDNYGPNYKNVPMGFDINQSTPSFNVGNQIKIDSRPLIRPATKNLITPESLNFQLLHLTLMINSFIQALNHMSNHIKSALLDFADSLKMYYNGLEGNEFVVRELPAFTEALKGFLLNYKSQITHHPLVVNHKVAFDVIYFENLLDKILAMYDAIKADCNVYNISYIKAKVCPKLDDSIRAVYAAFLKLGAHGGRSPNLLPGQPIGLVDRRPPKSDPTMPLKIDIENLGKRILSPDGDLQKYFAKSKLYPPAARGIQNLVGLAFNTPSLDLLKLIYDFLVKFQQNLVNYSPFADNTGKYLMISNKNLMTHIDLDAKARKALSGFCVKDALLNVPQCWDSRKDLADLADVLHSQFIDKGNGYRYEPIEGPNAYQDPQNYQPNIQDIKKNDRSSLQNKIIDYLKKSIKDLDDIKQKLPSKSFSTPQKIFQHLIDLLYKNFDAVGDFGTIKNLVDKALVFYRNGQLRSNKINKNHINYITFGLEPFGDLQTALVQFNGKIQQLKSQAKKNKIDDEVDYINQNARALEVWLDNLLIEDSTCYEIFDGSAVEYVLPQYTFDRNKNQFAKTYPAKNPTYVPNNLHDLIAVKSNIELDKQIYASATSFPDKCLDIINPLIDFYNKGVYTPDDATRITALTDKMIDAASFSVTRSASVESKNGSIMSINFDKQAVEDFVDQIKQFKDYAASVWHKSDGSNSDKQKIIDGVSAMDKFFVGLDSDNDYYFDGAPKYTKVDNSNRPSVSSSSPRNIESKNRVDISNRQNIEVFPDSIKQKTEIPDNLGSTNLRNKDVLLSNDNLSSVMDKEANNDLSFKGTSTILSLNAKIDGEDTSDKNIDRSKRLPPDSNDSLESPGKDLQLIFHQKNLDNSLSRKPSSTSSKANSPVSFNSAHGSTPKKRESNIGGLAGNINYLKDSQNSSGIHSLAGNDLDNEENDGHSSTGNSPNGNQNFLDAAIRDVEGSALRASYAKDNVTVFNDDAGDAINESFSDLSPRLTESRHRADNAWVDNDGRSNNAFLVETNLSPSSSKPKRRIIRYVILEFIECSACMKSNYVDVFLRSGSRIYN